MNDTMQDLSVSACGFIASLATAAVLFLIEKYFGFAFYSLMFWFLIPVGAILSGLVASGGYYYGALFFGLKPSRLMLINILFVSISTFFFVYWLNYHFLDIDGKLAHDLISFTQYMNVVLTHQSSTFYVHGKSIGMGESGWWGYVDATLQIVGFAVGGIVVFVHLSDLPYCQKCHAYLKNRKKQERFTGDPESLTTMTKELANLVSENANQKAWDLHGVFGEAKQKGCYLKSELNHKQCPTCKINWLRFSAKQLVGNNWKDVEGMKFANFFCSDLKS